MDIFKRSVVLILIVLSTGCSSLVPKVEDLKQASTCQVWKDGLLGSRTVVEVHEEVAKQKVTCWLWNTFACTYTDYTFRPHTSEVLSDLPPADKTIGKLEGNRITVNMSGVTVDPMDLKDGRVDYELQGPVGPKQRMTTEFNAACTKRQATLGIFAMMGK